MIEKFHLHKILILFLIPLCFLSSCKSKAAQNKGTIGLVAWVTYQGTEKKKFDELTAAFTRIYKEKTGLTVKILARQVPFDDLITNIKMACMSGRTPDIARVDANKVLELAYHKVLVELDTLPKFGARSIEEKASQYMKVPFYTNVVENKKKGKRETHLYGLPEQTTCLALFWNRKIFREFAQDLEKAGLDPKRAPRTWDELIKYSRVLTRKEGDAQYYGFGMNNSLWWTMPFFGAYGAKLIKADKEGKKFCGLGDDLTTAAMQLKVDLYRKEKIESGAWKSGAIGPDVGFVNEKYAMILMGPWKVKEFREKGLDFGVSLIPGLSKERAARVGIKNPRPSATNVGGNNMVIFQSCQHKQAAYDFISYLTSWKVQLEWCLDLKQIPISKKAADILSGRLPHPSGKKISIDPVIGTFMDQIRYAVLPPQLPRYGYIESDIVNPEMELALKGEKDVRKALKTAADKIDKEILSLVNE